MLKQLKNRIKRFGIAKVTSDLGYRSQNSVMRWVKAGEIPISAKEKVKKYLEETK